MVVPALGFAEHVGRLHLGSWGECWLCSQCPYRSPSRNDAVAQKLIAEVISRHAGEAVIVYCISRKETEQTAAMLRASGAVCE